MRKIFNGLLAAVALTALAGAPARADTITPLIDGGGWSTYFFGAPGSDFQDLGGTTIDFTFTLASSDILRVTDGFNDGDQFHVTIAKSGGGTVTHTTSVPVFDGTNFFDCWSCAFFDPAGRFSRGTFVLDAGSYVVTGTAPVSPFGSGEGAIALGGGVPEPATWALMLLGFGGLGAALRRSRRQAATLA